MIAGLPGLAGTDHVGFTVPDIEAATRFFVDMIGCTLVFEIGPFESDDDWMQTQLGVDPRAVIRTLRMFRCKTGPSFEIFEYELEGRARIRRAIAMWAGITWPFMSRTLAPLSPT
jgi:catechol 2,3-dioxygenase-like lactoylglutathione lyase family enzyme